jgi:hypothetical protein
VKSAIPPVEQMQQTAGCAQTLSAWRAAELVRGDGSEKAMQRGERFLLTPQLQSGLERRDLCADKRQKPPQRRAVQSPFVNPLLVGGRHIADHPAAGRNDLLEGTRVLLQIFAGQGEQTWAGITSVGEYESRAGR